MKLKRKEQQEERNKLKDFMNFADDLFELSGGKFSFDDEQREVLPYVARFLERELCNRLEKGRKKKSDEDERSEILQLYKDGEKTMAEVMSFLKISKATFFRYLKEDEQELQKKLEKYKKIAGIKKMAAVFWRLSRNEQNFTPEEEQMLVNGIEIIKEHLGAAESRSRASQEWREKLSDKLETDQNFKKELTKVRKENAKKLNDNITFEQRSLGGQRGGAERAERLSPLEKKAIAIKANQSRKLFKLK